MTERWLPYPLAPRYQISDLGRVIGPRGHLLSLSEVGQPGRKYLRFTVGKRGTARVHQAVALTFIGPRPEGTEVCHNNGNRLDNRASNLRYGTRLSNVKDSWDHGRGPSTPGEANPWAKLTEDAVRFIRASSESTAALAGVFFVHSETIRRIRNGDTWRHVR